jgi:hypothetical protein
MAIKHRRGQDKDNIVPPQEKWIGSQVLFLYFKNKQQQKTHKFYLIEKHAINSKNRQKILIGFYLPEK